MKRIIFQSTDGVGIGHIIRGFNIAKELKKIYECEILFVTNTPFTDIFRQEGFPFEKGGANPHDIYQKRIERDEYQVTNEKFLITVAKKYQPHIIVFDSILMPRAISFANERNIFLAYIFREINDRNYLLQSKQTLNLFDLILDATSPNSDLGQNLIRIGLNKKRLFYTGNIFREADPEKIDILRRKYGKNRENLTVTITAGGGGTWKYTEKYFAKIGEIIKNIDSELKRKNRNNRRINWVLVKGPLFSKDIRLPQIIKTYDYEMDMPELFHISDLVISSGGYNSVNEIVASRTPAVIYPFRKMLDSQISRVSFYNHLGFIQPIDIDNLSESMSVFRRVMRPQVLKEMREAYNNYLHKNGKRLAATIIWKEFMRCEH